MTHRAEDGPPCIVPRAPRQSTIRATVAPRGRYLVCWGLWDEEREVATFAEALAIYVERAPGKGGAKIWNIELMDIESDGLTSAERDAVESADEMHQVIA